MKIPRRWLAAGAGALVLALLLSLTVGRLSGPSEGMNPGALQRIEAKNRAAAAKAAAVQRAESAAQAEAADRVVAERESAADTPLTRFESEAPAAQ